MNRLIKSVPNLLTAMNLSAGCAAIVFAFRGELEGAFWATIVALVFDFLDGFMARLLKAYSPLGKELDSLADMVSFGVAPAAVMYAVTGSYAAFFIAVLSAFRLAKFNLDERQTTDFIGLPTPANAVFFMALGYIFHTAEPGWMTTVISNSVFQWIVLLGMPLLLVSEVPMFSLKFKSAGWRENRIKYSFVLVSLAALMIFRIPAIPFIVLGYVLYSVIRQLLVTGDTEQNHV